MVNPLDIKWRKIYKDWHSIYPLYKGLTLNQISILKETYFISNNQKAVSIRMKYFYHISLRKAIKYSKLYYGNYIYNNKKRKMELKQEIKPNAYPYKAFITEYSINFETLEKEILERKEVEINNFEQLSNLIRSISKYNWDQLIFAKEAKFISYKERNLTT